VSPANHLQDSHAETLHTHYAGEALASLTSPRKPSAISDLVLAFPPERGYKGACTTIRHLSQHGLTAHALGLTPTKAAAVKLIGLAAMERVKSDGKGTKATKRIHLQRIARAEASFFARHGVHMLPPSVIQAAADRIHDERTEGFSKRTFRTNHHD
jgi:hypothetical protein